MRILAILVLLLTLTGAATVRVPHKQATFLIKLENGTCSATGVGQYTLLTAAHCFEQGRALVRVGKQSAMQVGDLIKDGRDHVLVRVSIPLAAWVKVGPPPKQADRVHFYGNPVGRPDWYREGVMVGIRDTDNGLVFQMPTYGGDSGSGIFDTSGRLVAVVSGIPWAMNGRGQIVNMEAFTIAEPLSFTPEQWKAALQ